jgi:hypothetical protein
VEGVFPLFGVLLCGAKALIEPCVRIRLELGHFSIARDSDLKADIIKSMTCDLENVRRQAHPLRHLPLRNVSPDPAAAGFFRCFRGLCEWG